MKWNKQKKQSRWDNDYVFKNDWIICLLPFANIIPVLFVIGILETVIVLCSLCNTVYLPNWSFYIFAIGIVVWMIVFITKIFPAYLKGCGMLIYQPKQPSNREVKE